LVTSGCSAYTYSSVRSSIPAVAKKLDKVFIDLTPDCQPGQGLRKTVRAESKAEYDQRDDTIYQDHRISRRSTCE
jgi:hypothetical protein